MAKAKSSQGLSIVTMTILIGIVVTYLLWGIATGMYDTAQGNRWVLEGNPGRRPGAAAAGAVAVFGVIAFVSNSVMYIPSIFQVVTFVITQRPWYFIIVLFVEAGVLAFGVGSARLEKSLRKDTGFKTNRKVRQIALPTPDDD